VRDRRFGQRKIHADTGRALPRTGEGEGQGHRVARRLRPPARRRLARRRGLRRSVTGRQDHPQQSCKLRRGVRLHPRDVREGPDGAGTRIHRRYVFVQFRRWPLPDLRRQWLRARRNAVPFRRLSPLSGLRRHALPARNAGGHDRAPWPGTQRGRRPGIDRQRGHRVFLGRPRGGAGAGATGRRRPRIREAWPAGADAVRRRGTAPEAGRLPGRGGERQAAHARHAVPVRRADHRPALRRRGQADAGVPQAACRGTLGGDHRAQHGRRLGRGLADRPGPGRRRRWRRSGGRRHAGRRRGQRPLPYRPRTEVVSQRHRAPCTASQRGPAGVRQTGRRSATPRARPRRPRSDARCRRGAAASGT
jgi:hypothetical protein